MDLGNLRIVVLSVFYNTKNLLYPLYMSFKRNSGLLNYDFVVYDNSDNPDERITSVSLDLSAVKLVSVNPATLVKDIPAYNGSAKHTKTIELALNALKGSYDICVLLDSDVIITSAVKPYIEQMIRENYTLCGYHDITSNRDLIHPCALIINLNDILKHNIHFYDNKRMYGVPPTRNTYDTGMSFYEDVLKKNLKVLEIPYNAYYSHFGAGSRDYKKAGKVLAGEIYRDLDEWLTKFNSFYM